jgi:uncharacterized glyoxalase superfamily protein PhnB
MEKVSDGYPHCSLSIRETELTSVDDEKHLREQYLMGTSISFTFVSRNDFFMVKKKKRGLEEEKPLLEPEFGQRTHHCTKHRQDDYNRDECIDGFEYRVRVYCCCHG